LAKENAMSEHFRREIDKLKKMVLTLSARVEEGLQKAVRAVEEKSEALAREVIDTDPDIDHSEVEVEEECLKILALHQPVAIDLRFIVAVLKINNDLERIGDLAVNIAERAVYLVMKDTNGDFLNFSEMAQLTLAMLKNALDSLVNMDVERAREVCGSDDEVDALNRRAYELVKQKVRAEPGKIGSLVHLLSVSRHLERIADLTTNIAEDVIYMVEGEIVRHRAEDYRPDEDEE
jgi:phosphate transport system protein